MNPRKSPNTRHSGKPPAPAPAEPLIAGQSIELLKELHILTREGKLNQDSRRKLKQVRHLYQFIEPLLVRLQEAQGDFTLVDLGAGKSYLGFILYDLFLHPRHCGQIFGIETRAELITRSRELAGRLGFSRMHFEHLSAEASIHAPTLPARVDIVTALHACDTATDDAIRFALHKRARFVVLAPCCQAEVAAVLRQNKSAALARTPLAELWRHPIHTREFGSVLTNVLRCLQLEAHAYRVTTTELVGWEHSLKNELIIAEYTGQTRGNAAQRLAAILHQLGLEALSSRFLDFPVPPAPAENNA